MNTIKNMICLRTDASAIAVWKPVYAHETKVWVIPSYATNKIMPKSF